MTTTANDNTTADAETLALCPCCGTLPAISLTGDEEEGYCAHVSCTGFALSQESANEMGTPYVAGSGATALAAITSGLSLWNAYSAEVWANMTAPQPA